MRSAAGFPLSCYPTQHRHSPPRMTSSVYAASDMESLARLSRLYQQSQSASSIFKPRPIRLSALEQLWLAKENPIYDHNFPHTKSRLDVSTGGGFQPQAFQDAYLGLSGLEKFSNALRKDSGVGRIFLSRSVDIPHARTHGNISLPSVSTQNNLRGHQLTASDRYEPIQSFSPSSEMCRSSNLDRFVHPFGDHEMPKPVAKGAGSWNNLLGMSKMSKDSRKSYSCAKKLKQKAIQQKKKLFFTTVSRQAQNAKFRFKQNTRSYANCLSSRSQSNGGESFNTAGDEHKEQIATMDGDAAQRSDVHDRVSQAQSASGENMGTFTRDMSSKERVQFGRSTSNKGRGQLVRMQFRFHDQNHHIGSDGKKTFRCPQCSYVTDRKNNLKRHIVTMHQESAKILECCGVGFQSKAALRDHNAIFHRGGYRCQVCSRNFCRKALLRRHLTVHSGQKDFFCELCGYATSHKSNLERHQRVHSKRADCIEKRENLQRVHSKRADCIEKRENLQRVHSKRADCIEKREHLRTHRAVLAKLDVSLGQTRMLMFPSSSAVDEVSHIRSSEQGVNSVHSAHWLDTPESCVFKDLNSNQQKRKVKRSLHSKRFLLPSRLRDTYFEDPPVGEESSTSLLPSCSLHLSAHNMDSAQPEMLDVIKSPEDTSPTSSDKCILMPASCDIKQFGDSCLDDLKEQNEIDLTQSGGQDTLNVSLTFTDRKIEAGDEAVVSERRKTPPTSKSPALAINSCDESDTGSSGSGRPLSLPRPKRRLFSLVYTCPDCLRAYHSQPQLGAHVCPSQATDQSLRVPVVTSVLRRRLEASKHTEPLQLIPKSAY